MPACLTQQNHKRIANIKKIWADVSASTQLTNGEVLLAGKGAETPLHPHLQVLDSAVTSFRENPQANASNANSEKQGVKQNYGNSVKKNTPSANKNHYTGQGAGLKITPIDVTIFPDKLLDYFERWPTRLILFVDNWCKSNKKMSKQKCFLNGYWWTRATGKFILEKTKMTKSGLDRARDRLRSTGVLITKTFNEGHGDQTLWYRIDYEQLRRLKPQTCSLPQIEAGLPQNEVGITSKRSNVIKETNKQTNNPSLSPLKGEKKAFENSVNDDPGESPNTEPDMINNETVELLTNSTTKRPPAKTKRFQDQFSLSDDRFGLKEWIPIAKDSELEFHRWEAEYERFVEYYASLEIKKTLREWQKHAKKWNPSPKTKKPDETYVIPIDDDGHIAEFRDFVKDLPSDDPYHDFLKLFGGLEACEKASFYPQYESPSDNPRYRKDLL